ncbi:amidohydrolase [Caulobacter mirabilis]|uniref:Amidohydrolase n=1 Tax=Caulobacter mirabilis TaxID=69666 RepID=A0A2D2AXW7_9CAUL|nr:amidohydrolase [Caulobacter mirabilis]ATQ42868.1 amidohydrolase [Caulobacter mirabilis]
MIATRRRMLSGAAAATGLGLAARAWAAEGPVDLLFVGGPILTMDETRPSAEAVAVRGGRIVAVGARSALEGLRGTTTRVVDLEGRPLLPGFVDAHSHLSFVGLQATVANLLPPPDGPGRSIAALQAILRAWMADNGPFVDRYRTVIGFGYDDSQLAERRHPTRDDLDQVSTELPVFLIHQSGHFGAANSVALQQARITAETPDPEGGVIRRRPGSREPNGVLEEHAFFTAFGAQAMKLDEAANLGMIERGAKFYARFGYTTAQEGRASIQNVALLKAAGARGLLPLDVVAYPDIVSATAAILPTRQYLDRFRVAGAKLTIDGSPQGKTAWLTQPYFKPPEGRDADYRGYPAIKPEQALAEIDKAFANGWQLITHCNGDAAIDLLIEGVGKAEAKYGGGDRRPVLIHGQTLRRDQVAALKRLGVVPSLFPMHTFYWGDWHRESVLGPARAETISPTGWVLAQGMRFTTHHDAPVANPDAMRVLSATVTRRTRSGRVLGPDQRVSVETTLRAMTEWAAWQHFEEDAKGRIAPGMLADLIVLSDNPLTVDPDALAGLKVVETYKEGRSIYRG